MIGPVRPPSLPGNMKHLRKLAIVYLVTLAITAIALVAMMVFTWPAQPPTLP